MKRASFAVLIAALVCAGDAHAYSGKKPVVVIEGASIRVDGRPFFVKAVSYDPSYPGKELFDEIPPAVIEGDFKSIKDAGFNAVRTYEPFNDTLLDLAEKYQLYVIEGILRIDDATDFRSKDALEQLKQAAISIVERHRNRPSILFWSLWNDAPFHWGGQGGNVARRFGLPVVDAFLHELYRAVKATDPTRPVTAANVLNAPGYEVGFGFLDVIGLNVYLGVADWVSGSFDVALGQKTMSRVATIAQSYRKPVYVSELGQSDFAPVTPQAEVILGQLQLIGDRLAGFCLFQWQDNWAKGGDFRTQVHDIETHWGLVDAYRQPKRGFAAVAAAVKAAPKVAPSATPQAGQQKPSARTIAGGALAEGFEFADNQALLGAYSVRKKGASSFRATLEAAGGTSTHLLLAFVPEDFGAWLYLARTFTGERDWSKYRSLRFSMKSQGPLVNLSPFVLTADGSVLRGAATVTKNDEWQDFRLDLQALFHDFPFEKTLGRAANPVTTVDLRRVTGLGIKINDVANFEQIGQTTNVRLDDLVLEP